MPVLGITGTGGSGKSSLTDELIRRLRLDQDDKVAPRRRRRRPDQRRTGGALLGDRIRMNAIDSPSVFFRSLATRSAAGEVPEHLDDVVAACKVAGCRPGDRRDTRASARATAASSTTSTPSLYVMTPEFGAASQLEKIDMLDLADVVAINKFDRRGGEPTPFATCAARWSATASSSPSIPRTSRSSAPSPPASTTTA